MLSMCSGVDISSDSALLNDQVVQNQKLIKVQRFGQHMLSICRTAIIYVFIKKRFQSSARALDGMTFGIERVVGSYARGTGALYNQHILCMCYVCTYQIGKMVVIYNRSRCRSAGLRGTGSGDGKFLHGQHMLHMCRPRSYLSFRLAVLVIWNFKSAMLDDLERLSICSVYVKKTNLRFNIFLNTICLRGDFFE